MISFFDLFGRAPARGIMERGRALRSPQRTIFLQLSVKNSREIAKSLPTGKAGISTSIPHAAVWNSLRDSVAKKNQSKAN